MLSDTLSSQSPGSLALSLILLPLLYILYAKLVKEPVLYSQLPWPGLPKGRFGKLKARFSLASRRESVLNAFRQYSAKGQAFMWQEFLGRPMVVLPPSQLRWILDQPHDVINSHDFFNDFLALETSLMDPKVHGQPLHTKVVSNQLNRALGWTPLPILDELTKCFNQYWGFSPDWHEEVVWDSYIKFVARTVNRMFVGEEICRNKDFLDSVVQYAVIFIIQGTMLRPFPEWIRNILAVPMTIPIRKIFNRLYKHIGPIVERRKVDLERAMVDSSFRYNEPKDLLQWIIQDSYKSRDETDKSTARIVKRFLAINFAAIHTTTMNSTLMTFDLAASDPKHNYIGQIRDEIAAVYKECKGNWTKAHLVKLPLLDSALRETLRLGGGGGTWTPSRKVVAKDGITLPNGMHVPSGAHVAIPSFGVHHPDDSYFEYDPFRYAQTRAGMSKEDIISERNLQATATGEDYLPFGHGRDACPGRFFAVQEIKLMMVHLFLNYEIKPLEQRPENVWMSDTPTPPTKAKISVRKISPPELN